jgi:hypothetical protein
MDKPRLFWIALAGCCAMSSAADSRPDDRGYDPAAVAQDAALRAVTPHAATHARAELERAFWDCDHAATIRLLDVGEAGDCSRATEALLQTAFERDFAAMLAWWQRNKAAEHTARGPVKATPTFLRRSSPSGR